MVNKTAIEEFETVYSRRKLIGAPVSKVLSEGDNVKTPLAVIADLVDDADRESGR